MRGAVVGVADHGGWAALVTVGADGTVLDRRRVELVGPGLPKIPHHVEAQGLPIAEGVALVERVRESAAVCAGLALDGLAEFGAGGIALRVCPALPGTVEERIRDVWARNNADWVMYRHALAGAAEARGWTVAWFDAKRVGAGEFASLRKVMGAPWGADQRLAMAGAMWAIRGAPAAY